MLCLLLIVCAHAAEGGVAAAEESAVEAQIIALSNQLDRLLELRYRDDGLVADIYLRMFELAPHRETGKLAALHAYAYLFELGRTEAALGLLEEMARTYLPDEEVTNLMDPRYPLRLAASAKVERARLLAKKGLYQAALEELALVRCGKKAGVEGFAGMTVGEFRYFAPTEVLVALYEALLTSKLDAAAGLVRYRSILEDFRGSDMAWINFEGVRYPLDRAVAEKVFDLVSGELFLFARADAELKDVFDRCWTDECRAQALLLRAELRAKRPEGATQSGMAEQEKFLTKLVRDFAAVRFKRLERTGIVVYRPSCVAALELGRLYSRAKRHAYGIRKLEELLDEAKDGEIKGHIALAIARTYMDSEGPQSPGARKYFARCLTEYAFEPYYPYRESEPKYIIDAVDEGIREEILGGSTGKHH